MRHDSDNSLSIILPSFNEEANLRGCVLEAIQCVQRLGIEWELIIVDDGSSDGTYDVALSLVKQSRGRIRVIQHDANRGYGTALKSGFQESRKSLIFFTDSDGQFRFDQLAEFLSALGDKDMVLGFRQQRKDPWFRKLNSSIGNLLARLMFGIKVRDINCAYKLLRADPLKRLPLQSDGALINTEILAFAKEGGWTYCQLPVRHFSRKYGLPTGAKPAVILKTFQEYFALKARVGATAMGHEFSSTSRD